MKYWNRVVRRTIILLNILTCLASGHGGGDFGLMGAFIKGVMHQDQSYTCNAKLVWFINLIIVMLS
jgi:hypothetical protein